jgi:hypothetical protein
MATGICMEWLRKTSIRCKLQYRSRLRMFPVREASRSEAFYEPCYVIGLCYACRDLLRAAASGLFCSTGCAPRLLPCLQAIDISGRNQRGCHNTSVSVHHIAAIVSAFMELSMWSMPLTESGFLLNSFYICD